MVLGSFPALCPIPLGLFIPMADNSKRVNCVKVCFTDREYIDLNRVAALDGRSKADMAYVLVRRGMYGIVNAPSVVDEGTGKDSEAP